MKKDSLPALPRDGSKYLRIHKARRLRTIAPVYAAMGFRVLAEKRDLLRHG